MTKLYKIPISIATLQEFIDNSIPDSNNKNCLLIQDDYIKHFAKEITKHENIPAAKIQGSHAKIYTVQT